VNTRSINVFKKKTGEKGAAALFFDVTTALTKNVM
jgi:hypothetical protein